MTQLAGKTVLVTGATRGIGRAIVRAIYEQGGTVVAHYGRDRQGADALAAEFPQRLTLLREDLSAPGAGDRLWAAAEAAAAGIDVLVNNAGIYAASPPDDPRAWLDGWQANLQVNLQAPADLCRNAIGHFTARGGGIIINMASRSSHRGDGPAHLAYGAAKGGLLALTKGIARGYGRQGVLAYALAPGWVRTAMAESHIASVGEAAATAGLPLGEVTPPGDIAEMVAFLASGRCRHATGSTIDITGADYVR